MKLLKPVEIDLCEFVKSGTFDFLKPGQTREWVLNNFPDPDGFETDGNWKDGDVEIFTYGDFELHFSKDILYLIFADFDWKIGGGKSMVFTNLWIFEREPSELNLPYVLNEMLKAGIDFSTKRNDRLSTIVLKTLGGVELHFESDESVDPNDYTFRAFWLKSDIA